VRPEVDEQIASLKDGTGKAAFCTVRTDPAGDCGRPRRACRVEEHNRKRNAMKRNDGEHQSRNET
jgi:hypothetical protein